MMRKVILYPGEEGYIVAECPSLPGCISQGKTRTQALENIREAISLYIKTLVEEGEPGVLNLPKKGQSFFHPNFVPPISSVAIHI
jgi:predicted RNase H-like HicB family nuclease